MSESAHTCVNQLTCLLGDILKTKLNIKQDELPTRMQYSRYNSLVTTLGVQLVGWPEIDAQGNPIMDLDKLKTVPQWQRLIDALATGVCRWEVVPPEELALKKNAECREQGSRAVTRPGARSRQKQKRPVKSKKFVVDSSDDEGSNHDSE